MADVFISYARPDRERIAALAVALEHAGFSVWWDRHIGAGATFAEAIEAELESARAVVVAWSKPALVSNWVRDEAAAARDQGKLIPVSIDGTVAPLGFRQYHTIDLTDWTGDPSAPAIGDLLRAIELRVHGGPAVPPPPHHHAPASTPSTAQHRGPPAARTRRLVLAGLGLAVLASASVFAYRWFGGHENIAASATSTGAVAAPLDKSIAVLPFANRSAQADDAYFAEGMHDDLLAQLSRVGDLRVISRTSVMRYAETDKPIPEIARELGVGVILEGGVQRAGNRVRINVQLIDARTDTHLWSQTFDRELTVANLFDIQSEITRAIATELESVLDGPGTVKGEALPTQSTEAYDAYLLGTSLYSLDKGGPEAISRAAAAFGKATAIDPNFSDAYARKAVAHVALAWWTVDTAENRRLAQQALERARALAPEALETRVADGYYRYWGLHDYAGASEAARLALEQWPQEPRLWLLRANSARRAGDIAASQAAYEHAVSVDPRNASVVAGLAYAYASRGQLSQARQWLSRAWALEQRSFYNLNVDSAIALAQDDVDAAWRRYESLRQQPEVNPSEVDQSFQWLVEALRDPARLQVLADRQADSDLPDFYQLYAQYLRAVALDRLGHSDEARALARDARARMDRDMLADGDPRGEFRVVSILLASLAGDTQAARAGVAELMADPPRDQMWIVESGPTLMSALARIGEPDQAFDLVERTMDGLSPVHFTFLKDNVAFDRYRQLPRYRQLEARYEAWRAAQPKAD